MLKRVLVANRGEIAVRIIRACKEMGIETVAVYSDVDKYALHTQMADYSVCIGKAPSKDSYLNMQNILSAGVLTGCDSVHPGFGFLSENSKFAAMCADCGMKFIGPGPEVIDAMGNKSMAKKTMNEAGIPVIKGSDGNVKDAEEGLKIAKKIGFPVMIKASAGGGGKGMRLAKNEDEFTKLYETAKSEALSSFGDGSIYIEKYVDHPRHVEIQILADEYDNVIYLGERDCSIQRRNQKVVEEAPSAMVDETVRLKMGQAAVNAAKAVNYKNAGTIEFLLDKNGNFYFMEMNTRIQVEHPVTEMITGIDIVKEQIRIASGEKLKLKQEDIKISGYAIECRINAENPEKGFMPNPGEIENMLLPGGPGVRIDSSVYPGYVITPFYDSMIAKLIVYGKDRNEAICKMKRALSEFVIEGIETNIDFQMSIMENKNYQNGNYDTSFIKSEFEADA